MTITSHTSRVSVRVRRVSVIWFGTYSYWRINVTVTPGQGIVLGHFGATFGNYAEEFIFQSYVHGSV